MKLYRVMNEELQKVSIFELFMGLQVLGSQRRSIVLLGKQMLILMHFIQNTHEYELIMILFLKRVEKRDMLKPIFEGDDISQDFKMPIKQSDLFLSVKP